MNILNPAIKVILLISAVFIFSACSKKTPNEISKDIQKNADSLSHKLNRDVDTVVNKLSAKDTLFNSVKAEQIDSSGMPSRDFRKKNNDIFSRYINIKDYLSKDDSLSVQKEAKNMLQSLLDALSESSKEKISDTKKVSSKLETVISDLQNTVNLNRQRMVFSGLTDNLLEFIKIYGLFDKTIYYLNCDKIAGNKTYSWLVESKNIQNPYYGKDKANEKSIPCANIMKAWKFD